MLICNLTHFLKFLFQKYCNAQSKMPHWCLRNIKLIKVKEKALQLKSAGNFNVEIDLPERDIKLKTW